MPHRQPQPSTLPSRQMPALYSPQSPSEEHQYSTTVVHKPQAPRRRVRSILWQHPLKRRGGQRDLHGAAQEQGHTQQPEPQRQQESQRQQEYRYSLLEGSEPEMPNRQEKVVPHVEMQVPLLDLNPLANLNEYRRSLGLGPSKNLMGSAVYKDPNLLNAYNERVGPMTPLALSGAEEKCLERVREAFKRK
ncbi:hypothetical protein F5Y08DRAFT_349217 [Xylaria arbuscula]|nr:hypothetical protein F5Y08DRAFT_349217 [Xylaria arbuscula]